MIWKKVCTGHNTVVFFWLKHIFTIVNDEYRKRQIIIFDIYINLNVGEYLIEIFIKSTEKCNLIYER